ncbi:ABC transporter ATP-binding protein [Candidatus Woesearchaeota archaeon]|nr:ABC transporter ATP-binding protein [Candidatus Woesearchaeota archaeon]
MMLHVEQIYKNFGGITALDGCTLSIEKGRITALIGPNGSGKSTLFNIISRLLKEDSGKISFNGQDITTSDEVQVARQGISRTFQDVRLFRNLTIQQHLEIALSDEDEFLLKSLNKKTDHDQKIKEILHLVRLHKPLQTLATDLSYGQRKLLDLAIAMAKPHSLLMLDEPVAGINPQLRQEIKEILRTLHQQGETVLLIEHDMNFVMDLAGYIYVLDAGKVIAHGEPRKIQQNPNVLAAYLGE